MWEVFLAKLATIVVALLALTASPAVGQKRLATFPGDEIVAGVGSNLLLRGPWMSAQWRRPIPRAALFTALSVGYEMFLDPFHDGRMNAEAWRDVAERQISYFAFELLVKVVRGRASSSQ